MTLTLALSCVAALLAAAIVAVVIGRAAIANALIYGLCATAALISLFAALKHLLGAAPAESMVLPLGIPWLGAHFRIDALSAFFLAVVDLGAVTASLFAIGYGRHEDAPLRVLPFYPAFLAGMKLVVLADDAFTFLVSWEFMSLTSWALVMAHHRVRDNVYAGYVYLVMASFGTLALLLAFGLLAGSRRPLHLRADPRRASDGGTGGAGADPRADRRRLQSRPGAASRLAAARPSGGAEPRLRADERRDDQGRRLRLRPHRVRSHGRAGVVVEHGRARARRHHRRDGRALCADAARPQAAARLSHRGEHRHHLHRARPRAGVQGARHDVCRRAGAHRGPAARLQSFGLQEPAVLRLRRRAHRNRRARHGASRRSHPPHAANRVRVPGRLRRHFGAAAAQRLRLRMADVPGDPAEPATAVVGSQVPGACGRRVARALRRACRRLLRQGVRRDVPRPSAHAGGRARDGDRPVLARRDVFPRRALPGRRHPARPVHRCAGAAHRPSRRRPHAGADRRAMALDRADRREPQLL